LPGDVFIWFGCLTLVCLSALLIILLGAFAKGIKNLDSKIDPDQISILIPFRNEPDLLSQMSFLKRQTSETGIGVFWIDDFSDNITDEVLAAFEKEHTFNLFRRTKGKPGKKEAISFGIKKLNTEWVWLMDADSRPDLMFFAKGGFRIKKSWRMILFPLVPMRVKGFTRKLFDLEFLVLQLVTHASAILGRPLLANGASLLVNRKDYIESLAHRADFNIPSGDDVFALFAFQDKYGHSSIGSGAKFLSPMKVGFPNHFIGLWKQRVRWVSKTPAVPDIWYLFVSALVFISNTSFAVLLAYSFTQGANTLISWSIGAYFAVAFLFISRSIVFGKRKDLVLYIVPAILAYPFYLSALLFASLVSKPKWK